MYIAKKKNGYGWYIQVPFKDENGNIIKVDGKVKAAYLDCSFKRGFEPTESQLNSYGSLEGELIFRDNAGNERVVYGIAKNYQGRDYVELKLLEEKEPIPAPGYEYQDRRNGIPKMTKDDIRDFVSDEEDVPW